MHVNVMRYCVFAISAAYNNIVIDRTCKCVCAHEYKREHELNIFMRKLANGVQPTHP